MSNNNCKTCRAPIPAKAAALSCIFCSNVYHIKCVNVAKNHYDVLTSVPGGMWKCTGCTDKDREELPGQNCNEELIKLIKNLQKTVDTLQEDIKALKCEKKSDSEVYNAEEIINEIMERQKRERNIIIYKMKQNNNEENELKDIIKLIAPDVDTRNIKITRLGKSQNNKPAPLKVQLSSKEEVYKILKGKSALREHDDIDIAISTDQTVMQRNYYKKVKKELEDRSEKGENNLFIKYVNGIPTISKSKNDQ